MVNLDRAVCLSAVTQVSAIELPDKQFFKIGEVADLVGVKAHVLRYWESEFPGLRPMKTRGSHRMYRRSDVELAVLIRRLLHDEGYTIPGARRRVREIRRGKDKSEPVDAKASREVSLRAELIGVRNTLQGLLDELDRAADPPDEPVRTATVTAVVPKSAFVPALTRDR